MLTLVREREQLREQLREHPRIIFPEINKILFATDFSHCSGCTLEWLRQLAGLHGSTIHVVHVVPPRRHEVEPLPGPSGIHTVQTEVPAFLQKHPITNVPYEVWTAHGPVGDTLMGLARRENMDLLALGAHGHRRGGPGLGMVADQIVSMARIPVLTAGEMKRGYHSKELQRILYATDFSPATLRALPYAVFLAKKTGAQLLLVYVDTPETSADWLIEAEYEGKLLNLLPRELELHNVEPIIAIGPTWKGIVDTAAEHDADVIVTGFPLDDPGHSSQIHAQAHCPVLSVR